MARWLPKGNPRDAFRRLFAIICLSQIVCKINPKSRSPTRGDAMLKIPPIFLILVATLAIAQPTKRTAADSLPEAINQLRPAVVQIYYRLDQFPRETAMRVGNHVEGGLGTGFVVRKDGYVVTALH